ncbi:MAG: hypothetical protein QX199_06010 [Methylococcaceae bacterium]
MMEETPVIEQSARHNIHLSDQSVGEALCETQQQLYSRTPSYTIKQQDFPKWHNRIFSKRLLLICNATHFKLYQSMIGE